MTTASMDIGQMELPAGWKWVKLGDVCDIQNGYAFDSSGFTEDKGSPLIRIRDLKTNSPSVYFNGEYDKQHLVAAGSLLIGMDGAFRCYKWAGPESLLNQRVCKLLPDPSQTNLDFIHYSMNDYLVQIERQTAFTTVKHISSKQIMNIYLSLPPLGEQKRIAGILNEQMAAVEEAKKAAQQRLKAAKALPDAYLREVLPSSEDELPASWQWVKLGDMAEAIRGVTFKSAESLNESKEGYVRCVTTSAVQLQPDWSTARYIPANAVKRNDQILRVGDVLVSTANSKALVGNSCLIDGVPFECTFGAFVTVVRPHTNIEHRWLANYMHADSVKRFFYDKSSNTTNISNLKVSDLLEVEIPLPPLGEQQQIASELDDKFAGVKLAEASIQQELDTIEAMPAALLRKAFSGGL